MLYLNSQWFISVNWLFSTKQKTNFYRPWFSHWLFTCRFMHLDQWQQKIEQRRRDWVFVENLNNLISSDKILHKSTVHVKMEAQCFLCTQELPFGFLMVCQNCGIFQILVQDMVKTCVEKFRRVPKNFVEAWNLFYKESEVKSPPRCRFQRQETCKLPRIKTIAEDSNMDLSAYPLMTSLDHFIPR